MRTTPALDVSGLNQQTLLPGCKGLPLNAPLRQSEVGAQGWHILSGDVSYPVAVLKESRLQYNADWMRRFCEQMGAVLAPHGKTTMSPQLFDLQLASGAWGITLATMAQVQVAYRFGVRKMLVANQLVAPADIRAALHLLQQDPALELMVLVDSAAGVERLARATREAKLARPLGVLVELGLTGGRTGCRDADEVLQLASQVHAAPGLVLAGIEGYEGLLVSAHRADDLPKVRAFVDLLCEITRRCDAAGLFGGTQIVLSAGGSAYFDLVANGFMQASGLSRPVLPLLRSGCYLTHDHGFYHGLIDEMRARQPGLPAGGLLPALEVWSMVQSRPEPTLAILTMGKRDASYDIDLPIPAWYHRPGQTGTPLALDAGFRIEKMNDQHAYLRLPDGHPVSQQLAVGDLIGCGISHPCTTFDKWAVLPVVDDAYAIRSVVNTFF
ncbi:amino acid deaminase [Leeia oryzae]|uniref:amino acid deaminase n=1 Tax=Leeia oryzae TaxID=356662 RepID=UPI00035E8BC0|nr:amino acid deaminase [Leeia oryzae]